MVKFKKYKSNMRNRKWIFRYQECWVAQCNSDSRTCPGWLPVRRWSINKASRRYPREWRCAIQAARPREAWRSNGYVARWTRSWSGQRSSARNWPTRILISTTPISARCSVSSRSTFGKFSSDFLLSRHETRLFQTNISRIVSHREYI